VKQKYTGELRLIAAEFGVRYGEGRTIFLEHANDLFAEAVPDGMISLILGHVCKFPNNTYVFQTKNPERFLNWRARMPPKRILGATIESDLWHEAMGNAPRPEYRFLPMATLRGLGETTFITVEPIMSFLTGLQFSAKLIQCNPSWINIGADSKGHGLNEPRWADVQGLIDDLTKAGIEIKAKRNLERLMKVGGA
jgi:protein gp37